MDMIWHDLNLANIIKRCPVDPSSQFWIAESAPFLLKSCIYFTSWMVHRHGTWFNIMQTSNSALSQLRGRCPETCPGTSCTACQRSAAPMTSVGHIHTCTVMNEQKTVGYGRYNWVLGVDSSSQISRFQVSSTNAPCK